MSLNFQFVIRNREGMELHRSEPMKVSIMGDIVHHLLADFIKHTRDIYVGDSITIEEVE